MAAAGEVDLVPGITLPRSFRDERTPMRATMMYGAGDVRLENVANPSIVEPTDAVVRVVQACIFGSDLWTYKDMPKSEPGNSSLLASPRSSSKGAMHAVEGAHETQGFY